MVKPKAIPAKERRVDDPWRRAITQRLDQTDERHKSMQAKLEENTKITVEVKDKTEEMYDILDTFKGGMKVLGLLGKIGKWVGGIAATISAVIAVAVAADELPKHFPSMSKWWRL